MWDWGDEFQRETACKCVRLDRSGSLVHKGIPIFMEIWRPRIPTIPLQWGPGSRDPHFTFDAGEFQEVKICLRNGRGTFRLLVSQLGPFRLRCWILWFMPPTSIISTMRYDIACTCKKWEVGYQAYTHFCKNICSPIRSLCVILWLAEVCAWSNQVLRLRNIATCVVYCVHKHYIKI